MGKRVEVHKGERYHDWTVLRELDQIGYVRMVECICECGTIQVKRLSDLRRGKTKRCQKCKGKNLQVEVKKGQRFGRWVVLYEIESRISNRGDPVRMFRCRCGCGLIKDKRLDELRSGRSKECIKCNSKRRREENLKKYRISKGLDPDTPIGKPDGRERRLFSDAVRVKIFIRDNGKCQLCFKKAKQIHHIIPWNDCYKPEDQQLKFDPYNCIALCKDCHFHKAHGGNNNGQVDSAVADQLLSIAIKNTESHPELMAGLSEEVQQNLERISEAYNGNKHS